MRLSDLLQVIAVDTHIIIYEDNVVIFEGYAVQDAPAACYFNVLTINPRDESTIEISVERRRYEKWRELVQIT